jgi:NO-binding membrane sensor protein with MHYT domain
VAEVHHFTYGAFNPIAAYLLAFLGSFFGLLCASRARDARTRGRRNRWLIIAAFALGGAGIWLMHFSAMLGFDVPASPVRYDTSMTVLSLIFAVVAVGAGLLIAGNGARSLTKTVLAGALTGTGIVAMHYTGMEGMHVSGTMHYNGPLVLASVVIAVAAATLSFWFAVSIRGWGPTAAAAGIMAVAVCGMHYTGMAAMSVHLDTVVTGPVQGIRPLTMIVPITLITAATIIGVALSALQAMTEEEFTDGAAVPKRGAHAGTGNPWSLKQASMGSTPRRTPSGRPSPLPIPMRSTTSGN